MYTNPDSFIVGGRYTNRLGEYEVLAINGDDMLIRYDDGAQHHVTASVQARIAQNMTIETATISPYPQNQQGRNQSFFYSLGFLTARVRKLEAIIPPQSLDGFVRDYVNIKNIRPRQGQSGFYIHRPEADKWGCELRVTFEANDAELAALDFGPTVHVVQASENPGFYWRINNNGFWWRLLRLGFNMGDVQDINTIRTAVPITFRSHFERGYGNATS